jgi:hypothetical protein
MARLDPERLVAGVKSSGFTTWTGRALPRRDRPNRTAAHLAGRVSAELMQSAAEIGRLRLRRAASTADRPAAQA